MKKAIEKQKEIDTEMWKAMEKWYQSRNELLKQIYDKTEKLTK